MNFSVDKGEEDQYFWTKNNEQKFPREGGEDGAKSAGLSVGIKVIQETKQTKKGGKE
jgi:hypothetical protein